MTLSDCVLAAVIAAILMTAMLNAVSGSVVVWLSP